LLPLIIPKRIRKFKLSFGYF